MSALRLARVFCGVDGEDEVGVQGEEVERGKHVSLLWLGES